MEMCSWGAQPGQVSAALEWRQVCAALATTSFSIYTTLIKAK